MKVEEIGIVLEHINAQLKQLEAILAEFSSQLKAIGCKPLGEMNLDEKMAAAEFVEAIARRIRGD